MGSYWVFGQNEYWLYSQDRFMADLVHGHYYGKRQSGMHQFVAKLAIP